MTTKNLFLLLPVITFCAACGTNGENNAYDNKPAAAAETMIRSDSSVTTEQTPINSPERKIVRTADFRCKVKNVLSAATALETMVKSLGGIVQDSHMDNSGSGVVQSYYTADSLRQTEVFTTTATLTLRVPAAALDSVIHALPGISYFIESRTLRQSDVTYKYLSNELKNRIDENKTATARAMQLAKKSKEPIEVQEYENNREDKRIERKIENMQLTDDVSYATVTVALSQPEQVYTQIVVNPEYYNRTPFTLRCREALYSGWSFMMAFVTCVINIWPVWLLLAVVWFTLRKLKMRKTVLLQKP